MYLSIYIYYFSSEVCSSCSKLALKTTRYLVPSRRYRTLNPLSSISILESYLGIDKINTFHYIPRGETIIREWRGRGVLRVDALALSRVTKMVETGSHWIYPTFTHLRQQLGNNPDFTCKSIHAQVVGLPEKRQLHHSEFSV